jgi:hypothetical protein
LHPSPYNADVDREATTPAGKDLVAGSGIEFEDRALHELKADPLE